MSEESRHPAPEDDEDLSGPRQDFERSIYAMTDKEDRRDATACPECGAAKACSVIWCPLGDLSDAPDTLRLAGSIGSSGWTNAARKLLQHAADLERRCSAQSETTLRAPEGWKLVPIKPTDAMIEAGVKDSDPHISYTDAEDVYRVMLLAAPSTPVTESEYRCYHCKQIFSEPLAEEHFGTTPGALARCVNMANAGSFGGPHAPFVPFKLFQAEVERRERAEQALAVRTETEPRRFGSRERALLRAAIAALLAGEYEEDRVGDRAIYDRLMEKL